MLMISITPRSYQLKYIVSLVILVPLNERRNLSVKDIIPVTIKRNFQGLEVCFRNVRVTRGVNIPVDTKKQVEQLDWTPKLNGVRRGQGGTKRELLLLNCYRRYI